MKFHYISKLKIKFYLVFFCTLLLTNCGETDAVKSFKIHYENEKANSISFTSKGNADGYAVFVKGVTMAPMLGEFRRADGQIVFEPTIPFSNGQSYEIKKGFKSVFEFSIASKVTAAPELLAIYPSNDTVPENLLKMYFFFSKPMSEVGSMLDNIKVFNKTDAKEDAIFLKLENELWNAEHTQLTLWLDPGRIKRDLIPNQEKGLPIEEGKEYEITVTTDVKDADGMPLAKTHTKTLYVAARDSHSPRVKDWSIHRPTAVTKEALTIYFKEPLDAVLAVETIRINTENKEAVPGKFKLEQKERLLNFYPDIAWVQGNYEISVEPILEDLAGNNLNRLFDQNLSEKTAANDIAKAYKLVFTVD